MAVKRSHALHHGEKIVQQRRHTPEELARAIPDYIHSELPQQHAEFYPGLSYLPLGTLDDQGRPWVSVLVTKSEDDPSVGIEVSESNGLDLTVEISPDDPFYRALKQASTDASNPKPLFAGVGVDFTNRRRNKLAGNIDSINFGDGGKLSLHLQSNEHLGKCPTYITGRTLVPHAREPELVFDQQHAFSGTLPNVSKELINRVSTVFLATKHVPGEHDDKTDRPSMGLNHRGGPPGFVRVYEEGVKSTDGSGQGEQDTYLVLPDFSGNRFYQSLGNIESSEEVGLVFPDFVTGDVLYVTGDAKNLYEGEAETIMPRMSLITQVRITGAIHIKNAIALRLTSEEELSPYNPPIRYLRRELEAVGHTGDLSINERESSVAQIVSTDTLNASVKTFRLKLSNPIDPPLPGGFGVFDFSAILDTGYNHMNEDNPQAVNEDYIRTWTISSSPEYDAERNQFKSTDEIEITVKRQAGGLVSSFLHTEQSTQDDSESLSNSPFLKGMGGEFTCFKRKDNGLPPLVPEKMLWVAGGVGVTPFMSMWDGIKNVNQALAASKETVPADIVLVFAGRGEDIMLLKHFLRDTDTISPSMSLKIIAYQSQSGAHAEDIEIVNSLKEAFPSADLTISQNRFTPADFQRLEDYADREAFICGPEGLMRNVQEWLETHLNEDKRIHHESYAF